MSCQINRRAIPPTGWVSRTQTAPGRRATCAWAARAVGLGDRGQDAAAHGRQRQAQRQHGDAHPLALPAHRSALTDCTKLAGFQLGTHKAIVIYGYDYPDWPMDPVIEAFEALASQQSDAGQPAVASFDGLIHPVHRRGRVFGWQVRPLDD